HWELRHIPASKIMVCRARILKKSTRTSPLSALLLALLAGAMMPTAHTASAATGSITKEQSGLVASDSLTSGTSAYWTFGGSAAQHNYYEDAQGLHRRHEREQLSESLPRGERCLLWHNDDPEDADSSPRVLPG